MFIKGIEKVGIKELENSNALIDYSQTFDNVYKNLEDYNPTKKRKILLTFHGLKAYMEANKKWVL